MSCQFLNVYVSQSTGKMLYVCDNEENCSLFCEGENCCPLEDDE